MNDNNVNNNTNTNPNPLGVLSSFSEPVATNGSTEAPAQVEQPAVVIESAPEPPVEQPAPEPVQIAQESAPVEPAQPEPAPVEPAPQPVQPAPEPVPQQPVVQPAPQPIPQQPVQQPAQQPAQQPIQGVQVPPEKQMPQQQVNLPPQKQAVSPGAAIGAAGSNDSDKLLETDRFVIAYIGKDKYFYFLTKGWNWPFFFLGIFYLMYRKMYGKVFSYIFMTALVTIITSVVINLIPFTADIMYSGPLGSIVIMLLTFAGPFFYHIYFTTKVNSKYYDFAQKKSKKVEYVFNNFSKDIQEEICTKRGRGTVKNFVVGFILYSVLGLFTSVTVVILSLLIVLLFGPSYNGVIKYDDIDNITVKQAELDGYYTEKEIEELDTPPNNIMVVNGEIQFPNYSDLGVVEGPRHKYARKDFQCFIEFGKIKDYRDAETLTNQYSSYHTDAINILEKKAKLKGNRKPPKYELVMHEKINWYQISLDELKSSSIEYETQDYFANLDGSVYHVRVKAMKTEEEDNIVMCFDEGRTFVEGLEPQHKPSEDIEE